jgi:hypothetical protein
MADSVLLLCSGPSIPNAILLIYADPGTGSLVWQLLLASVIGGAFYARQLSRRIRQRLSGTKKAETADDLVQRPSSQPQNH